MTIKHGVLNINHDIARSAENPLYIDWIDTPMGAMMALCDDAALYMLEFSQRKALQHYFDNFCKHHARPVLTGRTEITEQIADELRAYFQGSLRQFTTPIRPTGTDFQIKVWRALRDIPYGQTRSYSNLAAMIEQPKAVRAVASANARNGLAIIIPCHRVISASGALGGYAGGLDNKAALLALEDQARK